LTLLSWTWVILRLQATFGKIEKGRKKAIPAALYLPEALCFKHFQRTDLSLPKAFSPPVAECAINMGLWTQKALHKQSMIICAFIRRKE
jgi:hypothetical protein